MDKTIVAILVGVLAGAAGGFIPKLFDGKSEADESATVTVAGDSGLGDRLAAIEATLERIAAGSMKASGGLSGNAPTRISLDDEAMAELKAATKETVKETMAEMKDAEGASGEARASRRPQRKRMKLADAATELELSGAQEDELRQIYADSYEDMLKLVAGENGDVEEVRRDMESLRADPSKAMSVMGKYMGNFTPASIGKFMTMRSTQNRRVQEAIGKDKADKLRREYTIEEANPLPIGGGMRGGFMGGR